MEEDRRSSERHYVPLESYHKRKKMLEEKYGKLIILKPYNDDNGDVRGAFSTPTERRTAPFVIVDNKQQKFVKQLQDITDEEGLKRAYETRDGLYQHYNKLFLAGTKDFPQDNTVGFHNFSFLNFILRVSNPKKIGF